MPPESSVTGLSTDVNKPQFHTRRVLFLCTGNAARSQMAEAFLRRYGYERFEVHSAGTNPVDMVHPLAVQEMKECGVDISHQRPKHLRHFVAERWDFVITTCDRANENCPVFPCVRERIHWSFRDPAGAEGTEEECAQAFRRVRDEILTRVRLFTSVQTRTSL